jgi:hypothetical protein
MTILRSAVRRPALSAVLATAATVAALTVALPPAAAATSTVPGTYVATTPTRVLDTRTGAYGNHKGAVGPGRATAVRVTGNSGVAKGAAAVAVTISVVSATRSGSITASTYGVSAPPRVTNVQFRSGQATTGLAVVKVSTGRIDLWNMSKGRVQLVMDVTGYYVGGTPKADGALHLRTPKRVVDTRSGLNGFHKGALGAGRTLAPDFAKLAGFPFNAGAVAAVVTVLSPTRSGSLIAYATGTTRPSSPLLDFTAGRAVSQYAVLPISDIQGLSLYNASSGSVQVLIDVIGFLTNGPAAVAAAQQVVAANRIFFAGTLPAHTSDRVLVLGRGGVPKANVAAVAVEVRVSRPGRTGTLVGGARQAPTVVSFGKGQRVSGHAILRVGNGAVTLRNTSGGALTLEVDVLGYIPSRSLTFPTVKSVARYPNDLTGDTTSDESIMSTLGAADGDAGATFVLLDLGAQSIHPPLNAANPGVALALTDPVVRLSYVQLTQILNSYLAALVQHSVGRAVTVAVGTNNDGDWSGYGAAARGADWGDLIKGLTVPAGVTVLGANDIESIFASTLAQARAWETAYFGATSADLVFNGALVGCPTVFGSTAACSFGWTQQDYVSLTRHVESGRNRVRVLPQIYFAVQAVQWANIYARSGNGLHFAGSLTELGADATTYAPRQGWGALVRALQWRVNSPSVLRMVDIAADI